MNTVVRYKKLKMLESLYDEQFKEKCIVVGNKREKLEKSYAELTDINNEVTFYVSELEKLLVTMNLSTFHGYEHYKNHISALYESSKAKDEEILLQQKELESAETECMELGIEVKKIEKLGNNISSAINILNQSKDFNEADEMWNIRRKNDG